MENVDHTVYIPPEGIVEMSERTGGLRLVHFGAAGGMATVPALRAVAGITKRILRGGLDYGTDDRRALMPPELVARLTRPSVMRGETVTYVLERIE